MFHSAKQNLCVFYMDAILLYVCLYTENAGVYVYTNVRKEVFLLC